MHIGMNKSWRVKKETRKNSVDKSRRFAFKSWTPGLTMDKHEDSNRSGNEWEKKTVEIKSTLIAVLDQSDKVTEE